MMHGFGTGGWRKVGEDVGHFVLGILPLDLILWIREWTDWPLPWIFKGQWPPGDPFWDPDTIDLFDPDSEREWFTQLDRVADIGRDTLGYDLGRTVRFAVLVWLAF